MFSSILLLPLFLFLFFYICSDLKNKILFLIGILGYLFNLIGCFYLLIETSINSFSGKYIYVYSFYDWINIFGFSSSFNIQLDFLAVMMSFTVLFVATMVNFFSIYYMANDPFKVRFFSYLALFTFCMLFLVTSSDLLQFFIGWELVGICSYLLINFWYTRKQANISATKAVLVNRIGDFFFLFSIALIFSNIKSVSFNDVYWFILTHSDIDYSFLNVTSLFLFFAVMSKSAQFGLHSWLPDAMEGPTPVSALIHAATMVTAGILLILRMSLLFEYSVLVSKLAIFVGSLTAFFAATTGFAQTDIKKIIAFSTCSQLGYMVCICGFGQFSLAFFHLITHAFFKSLLFLCAGLVIHSFGGEQDIRKMGGVKAFLPSVFISMTIASWALSGIPFLSGYYSKELIVLYTLLSNSYIAVFASFLLIISAFITSLYSAKLIYYVFLSRPRTSVEKLLNFHSEGYNFFFTQIPLFSLSVLSIFSGLLFKEAIIGFGSGNLLNSLSEFSYSNSEVLWVEYGYSFWKLLLLLSSISGYLYYYFVYKKFTFAMLGFKKTSLTKKIYSFFFNRWNFDFIVSYFLCSFYMVSYSNSLNFFFQKFIIDNFFFSQISYSIDDLKSSVRVYSFLSPQSYLKFTFLSIVSFMLVTFITINITF